MKARLHPDHLWIVAALVLATIAYLPGLHGGFLFDDFANLPALGHSGPIDNLHAFARYITSGKADPLGRPLSLLSFLVDARDWPAAPWPFKRTNLVIHGLNGLLLFGVLSRLGRGLAPPQRSRHAQHAAALGAAFWLLHPLLVSTTLFVVQREAMLSATFTLAGLNLWLHGRAQWRAAENPEQARAGMFWMLGGLVACTALAALSKANGLLLPLLAGVIEWLFLCHRAPFSGSARRHYRATMLCLSALPSALIGGYLIEQGWHGMVHGVSVVRTWTLGQRLLTEPRVLTDYLRLLWLPRPFTSGLFNDQIQASTSLLTPWSTLPCILLIAGLILAAFCLRRRWPALALAIAFYFAGQLLESSTVALELYFEHRNYLPSTLMFWPLALWLCHATPPTPHRRIPSVPAAWRTGLAAICIIGLTGMTYARASLWGNIGEQALLWARLNPHSPRAQTYAANFELQQGHPQAAISGLRPVIKLHPDQIQLTLTLLNAECALGGVKPDALKAAERSLRLNRNPGALLPQWFTTQIDQASRSSCPGLGYGALQDLLGAASRNPHIRISHGRRQDLWHVKGYLALVQGQADLALDDYDTALAQNVRPAAALEQAASLGAHGFPAQGLAHLDTYAHLKHRQPHAPLNMRAVHRWVLQRQHYWPREIARLRATLRQDLATRLPSDPTHRP